MQSAEEDPHTPDADADSDTSSSVESDTSSIEGDAQKVRLSFIDDQQPTPTRLLRIPHDILITLSTKPRKWLCYAAYVICGVEGTLQSYNEHQDLVDVELDGVVNEGDHFVYHVTGVAEFVDRWARDRRRSQLSVSIRSGEVVNNLKSYYGGCPFTRVPLTFSQCCHLIPHAKGSAYLRSVLRDRGDPDDNMDIDDPGNMIMMNGLLHLGFDNDKSIAFLATPNAFLKSNELPGRETVDPDKYFVTIHTFKDLRPEVTNGAFSDMTRGSGVRNLQADTADRSLNEAYLPRASLLDICYAVALLKQWGSERAKIILDKSTEKYYPGGGVRRGEDREGDMKRKEEKHKREQNNMDRTGRATKRYGNQATGDGSIRSAGGRLTERDERDDRLLDSLRWARYIFSGISPEDIEAKREKNRKKAEREEAERIERWQKGLYQNSPWDGVVYGEEPECWCPLPEADDKEPVSIDGTLSRTPQQHSPRMLSTPSLSPISRSKTSDSEESMESASEINEDYKGAAIAANEMPLDDHCHESINERDRRKETVLLEENTNEMHFNHA